jgi:hypothetical protein
LFVVTTTVSELDRLKEQVAYFKYWQGVMLVTDISVIGWLISSSDDASRSTVVLAFIGVTLLTVASASCITILVAESTR